MLLYDHATIGLVDDAGLSEIHQACKTGRVQHVEQLIYYGADMNCQNCGGNTALHMCAANNQEECARILLFRGIDKTIKNYANQNAAEVAIISGNLQLANVINNFGRHEVVPYQEMPKYNEKRRCKPLATMDSLRRSRSNPQLTLLFREDKSNTLKLCGNSVYDMNMQAYGYQSSCNDGTSSQRSDSSRSLSISSSGSYMNAETSTTLVNNSSSLEFDVPRRVVLYQGREGFGFVLRGAKVMAANSLVLLDFKPTPDMPGLQFFEHIDTGSVADRAGILLETFFSR